MIEKFGKTWSCLESLKQNMIYFAEWEKKGIDEYQLASFRTVKMGSN